MDVIATFLPSTLRRRAPQPRIRISFVFCLLLAACGGSGSETSPPSPATSSPSDRTPTPKQVGTEALAPSPTQLTPFILPFDSDDSSILIRSSLSSPDAIREAGGSEEPTSANQFDDTLGMQPSAPGGGVPGARFSFTSIPELANLPSGQLSIEVERRWLAVTNSEVRSTGDAHPANEHLLSHGSGPLQTAGKLYQQSNQRLVWFFRANEYSRSTGYVNTPRSSRFARITLSWTPTAAELYVDGLRTGQLPRTNSDPDSFSTIYIGNLLGWASDRFVGDVYVRNLIVSSKPVLLNTTQPLLAHIMLIGDSFVGGLPFYNIPNAFDGTIANNTIKRLIRSGAGFGSFSAFSNGGGQIQDNGSDPLELNVGQSLSRANAMMLNPSLIVFITGGNDTATFNSAQFTNDLHDHIEAFLGANGYPETTTQHVIVTTTTSNRNASHPTTLQMRQIMLELPTWWDNTYPSRAGAVSVIDMWALFGGNQVDSTLFGIADPVHPAASGNIVYGGAIAKEIIRLVERR